MSSSTSPSSKGDETEGSCKTTIAGPDHEGGDDFVDLLVGGYPYRTTRSVLLRSPFLNGEEETYLHALLSGRWKRTKLQEPIELPDLDGRLFFYILYYLQLGELPRAKTLLSKEDINALELQADFLGLTGLVDLCKATKDVLKGLKGTGDYDLTPISDFSFHIDTSYTQCDEDESIAYMKYMRSVDFEMKYTHQGNEVKVAGTYGETIGCNCFITKNDTTTTLYNETVMEMFQRLHDIIHECYKQNEKDANKISVSSVLQQTNIPPELQLWYAFVIDGMTRSYNKHKSLLLDRSFEEYIQFLFEEVLGDLKTGSGQFFSGDLRASTRTCTHRISEIK